MIWVAQFQTPHLLLVHIDLGFIIATVIHYAEVQELHDE